ncbi:MAG TPA: hypothetical protein VGO91_05060 [Pyrinomonadaceae bacterium]|jgi:hypothetical protein|nr:hypothetical protein [Pyrinomonadaceae bacterium]
MKKLFGLIIIAVGILSGAVFFIAGSKLNSSATDLTEIRSVGGNSVAEAYYQEMGHHGLAYSLISFACGLGIISISLGFGGLLMFDEGTKTPDSNETAYSNHKIE